MKDKLLKTWLSKSLPQSLKRPLSKISLGFRKKHYLHLNTSNKASNEQALSGLLTCRKGLTAKSQGSVLELLHIFSNGPESKKWQNSLTWKLLRLRQEKELRISDSLSKLDKKENIWQTKRTINKVLCVKVNILLSNFLDFSNEFRKTRIYSG